jgi:hypothetical protein
MIATILLPLSSAVTVVYPVRLAGGSKGVVAPEIDPASAKRQRLPKLPLTEQQHLHSH